MTDLIERLENHRRFMSPEQAPERHLIGLAVDALRERDDLVELLAEIREWLDGQQDAEYFTDNPVPIPNQAMRFCTAIDNLIGEYT